jgi:hypothetical protein
MDTLVGVGTILLAIVTAVLAYAALRTMALQQVQLERAYRPVVVPASGRREISFRAGVLQNAGASPTVHDTKVVVAVENVGNGPALNVRGILDAGGGASVHGSARTLHPVEGLGAGAANAVMFDPDGRGNPEPQIELWIRIAYEDVASVTYWTDMHYNVATRGWQSRVHQPTANEPDSPLWSGRRVAEVLPHLTPPRPLPRTPPWRRGRHNDH